MKRLRFILLILSLCIIGALYTHPVGDTDVFWHLKTGEWIVKNISIPIEDPFSFTTYENFKSEEDLRVRYILSQYWLGQVLFYLAYKAGGIEGLIILRMLILTAILLTVWNYLKKKGLPFKLILFFIILLGTHLARYSTDRPQLFSFLFTALLIHELEDLWNNRKRTYFTIPLINLLWANMHASALMGLFIELVYLLNLFIERNKNNIHRYHQAGIIILGIISTLINPNSYHVIPLLIKDLTRPALHFQFNTEYMSVFELLKDGYLQPEYLLFSLIGGLSLLSKKIKFAKRFLILFLMLISLYAIRFAPFFTIGVSMIGSVSLQGLRSERTRIFLERSFPILAIIILMVILFIHRHELMKFKVKDIYPEGAIEFILKNNLSKDARLLNYFEWGGYILWRTPELKTFIDGRVLRFSIWDDYFKIVHKPDAFWHDRLSRYRINLILLPLTRPEDGLPLNVMLLLLGHPDWKPVYVDNLSVVFAKKEMPLEEIPLEKVKTLLLENLRVWAEKEPHNPERKKAIEIYSP